MVLNHQIIYLVESRITPELKLVRLEPITFPIAFKRSFNLDDSTSLKVYFKTTIIINKRRIEMKQPYLIQRGTFRKEIGSNPGLDSIVEFDYMGSAEFEFGALPTSLLRVRVNVDKYVLFNIGFEHVLVTVLCKVEDCYEVEESIIGLAEDKYHHLKEFSAFDQFVKQDGYLKDKYNFWWDIENDYFFWATGGINDEFVNNTILQKPYEAIDYSKGLQLPFAKMTNAQIAEKLGVTKRQVMKMRKTGKLIEK